MPTRMNDRARPERKIWHHQATGFVADIWSAFTTGHGFVAARSAQSGRWRETCFPVGACRDRLEEFFSSRSPRLHDFYFCPNAFRQPQRRASFALPTPYAWVDIDEGDVNAFDPQPGTLIRTSPGRHQGIWWFTDSASPRSAERYSRALAYNFAADRNGWSVTKYLRVPFTNNLKPHYDRPRVELLRHSPRPQVRKAIALDAASQPRHLPADIQRISPAGIDPATVLSTYRRKLHLRTRALIMSKAAYAFERDRSKCIYEIIADLHHVGATPPEIGAVLWVNPYFISKHGQDLDKLDKEIRRVIAKLGRGT